MNSADSSDDKSLAERILHAVTYEAVAALVCAPLFAWLMHQPIERMGALNIAISVIAVCWNMVVTSAQDRLLTRRALEI